MAIHIIPEKDIHVTEAQYARYIREYKSFVAYHVSPPTLEEFIRGRLNDEDALKMPSWSTPNG